MSIISTEYNLCFGWRDCACQVEETKDAKGVSTFFVSCPETKYEGLWSPAEPQSLTVLWKEHVDRHGQKMRDDERSRDASFLRAQALHIYRTTEPGDSARRGIGAYL